MQRISDEISEDRETLIELMGRLGATRNPAKQAVAWVAEKAGRAKFSGATSGDTELGTFLALETLSLGVEGKRSLWLALQTIAAEHPELQATDLAGLVARAEAQRSALERERLRAASRAIAA